MMGFAVPERRKSASLTALIKESWRTGGVGEMRLSEACVEVGPGDPGGEVTGGEKCKVSLNGSGAGGSVSDSRDESA